jgi:hypothetical protein
LAASRRLGTKHPLLKNGEGAGWADILRSRNVNNSLVSSEKRLRPISPGLELDLNL